MYPTRPSGPGPWRNCVVWILLLNYGFTINRGQHPAAAPGRAPKSRGHALSLLAVGPRMGRSARAISRTASRLSTMPARRTSTS